MLDDERSRLEALVSYNVLDTAPEQAYDDITLLASMITRMPIALMSLVDESRQWFKSRVGLEMTETPRDVAFCNQTLREPTGLFVVPDAHRHPRFATSALVTGEPRIRSYAGAALIAPGGERLGALCVIDRVPRELAPEQTQALQALARQVMAQLNLRQALARLREIDARRAQYLQTLELSHVGLKRANSRLKTESLTDELTRLQNRRGFQESLESEFESSQRTGRPLSLFLLDVDHFKNYNDTFGHVDGDLALQNVAGCIKLGIRARDLAARYGGEEFAVVLPDTKIAGAAIIAERIRRTVEATTASGQPLTVSIGLAGVSPDVTNCEDLVRRADEALYAAKSAGRNRVSRYGQHPIDRTLPRGQAGDGPDSPAGSVGFGETMLRAASTAAPERALLAG